MLSLALAMEKLFGPMEPPSLVAGCAGCTVNTSAVPVGPACSSLYGTVFHPRWCIKGTLQTVVRLYAQEGDVVGFADVGVTMEAQSMAG